VLVISAIAIDGGRIVESMREPCKRHRSVASRHSRTELMVQRRVHLASASRITVCSRTLPRLSIMARYVPARSPRWVARRRNQPLPAHGLVELITSTVKGRNVEGTGLQLHNWHGSGGVSDSIETAVVSGWGTEWTPSST